MPYGLRQMIRLTLTLKIYRDLDTASFSTTMYAAPGPDQIWFTEDDLPSHQEGATFNMDGVMLAYKTFHLLWPGNDALPGTEDDGIQQSMTTVDIEAGMTKYINFTGRGLDNILFTEDDPVSDYKLQKVVVSTDSQERRSITTHYTSAGADGTRLTDDDIIGSYQITQYAENGNMVLFLQVDGAGPDGVWFTDDDRILYKTEY